jgi:hypothetical protein
MARYGDAAVRAVALVRQGDEQSPVRAWDIAVVEAFPHSKSSQEKGCPRSAFLGLCESGRVKGVPAGTYTRSKKNKEYALIAMDLLKQNPALASDVSLLWNMVVAGAPKAPNHQMAVVGALWTADLLLP